MRLQQKRNNMELNNILVLRGAKYWQMIIYLINFLFNRLVLQRMLKVLTMFCFEILSCLKILTSVNKVKLEVFSIRAKLGKLLVMKHIEPLTCKKDLQKVSRQDEFIEKIYIQFVMKD